MKKFLSLALVLVMALTLSVNVFAATDSSLGTVNGATTKPGTSNQIPVIVSTDSTTADTVYRVDVEWDSLAFTYTFGNEGTWNPATHSYNNPVDGTWDKTTATFTVKNHSNTAVNVTAAIADAAGNNTGVTASLTGETTVDLATAVLTTFENAPKATFTVAISGAPSEAATEKTIANITVKLN